MNAASAPAVRTVLIAACAASLSCWMTQAFLRAPDPLPSPTVDTGSIRVQLDRLTSLVESALDLRVAETRPNREPVVGNETGRLEESIGRLERLARYTGGGSAGMTGLNRQTPVHWPEVSTLEAWFNSDRKAAERSVQLLTPNEAMDRFGFPSRIQAANSEGGGMLWMYERAGPDGEEWNDLMLWFQDGYLVHLMR